MPSAVGYQPTLASEVGSFQERMVATRSGSITSIQAVYVPADDLTDPAPAAIFSHLDAVTTLSRRIASSGIYPAVDPRDSPANLVDPAIIGQEHYDLITEVKRIDKRYDELKDVISIMGIEELSPEDREIVETGRRIERVFSQAMFVATPFTGLPGVYMPLAAFLKQARLIVDGQLNHVPLPDFMYAGEELSDRVNDRPSTEADADIS